MSATPIHLLETYFGLDRLDHRAVRHLNQLPDGTWIDFAKQYQSSMDAAFRSEFLTDQVSRRVRLYCEPLLSESWEASVKQLYGAPSPLLGHGPDPHTDIDAGVASRMLEPLKKHLLVADSVYIRDSFYYCFDWLADNASRRQPDSQASTVSMMVSRLKAWLPLLVELRPLIDSEALIFMPYWMTPSFPMANYTVDRMNELGLSIRPQTDRQPRPPTEIDFRNMSEPPELPAPQREAPPGSFSARPVHPDRVILAWLNARLLGLDPMFPNTDMFDFSSRLYFRDTDQDEPPRQLTSDLTSFDVLPLRDERPIGIHDLMSLRKNEAAFAAVRSAVTECQDRLRTSLTSQATESDARSICRDIINERLDQHGGKIGKVVALANDNPVAATTVSITLGAAMLPLASLGAAVGVLAPALMSPTIAKWLLGKKDSESRALARLQALL